MIKALALFSGGLDSILACRMVMAQGVEVIGVTFVTPFFQYHLRENPNAYSQSIREKYGIEAVVEDISPDYLKMLQQPQHGFGRNFNPCIDCKILMLKRAREMLGECGAQFLISGEVLGQRPMSQRRDTLNVIERDSGSRSLLLRPLSARFLSPTLPEINGWVDRSLLGGFSGRGRSAQIELAKQFGIKDFPHPAGGCILTDPILGRRLEKIYQGELNVNVTAMDASDFQLLQTGRQFRLPKGGWLVVGRAEPENDRIHALAQEGDVLLYMEDRAGPSALLRRAQQTYERDEDRQADMQSAAAIVVRYGKKTDGVRPEASVSCYSKGNCVEVFSEPIADEVSRQWMI